MTAPTTRRFAVGDRVRFNRDQYYYGEIRAIRPEPRRLIAQQDWGFYDIFWVFPSGPDANYMAEGYQAEDHLVLMETESNVAGTFQVGSRVTILNGATEHRIPLYEVGKTGVIQRPSPTQTNSYGDRGTRWVVLMDTNNSPYSWEEAKQYNVYENEMSLVENAAAEPAAHPTDSMNLDEYKAHVLKTFMDAKGEFSWCGREQHYRQLLGLNNLPALYPDTVTLTFKLNLSKNEDIRTILQEIQKNVADQGNDIMEGLAVMQEGARELTYNYTRGSVQS